MTSFFPTGRSSSGQGRLVGFLQVIGGFLKHCQGEEHGFGFVGRPVDASQGKALALTASHLSAWVLLPGRLDQGGR